ncbi:serine carboxypeptidase [Rhodocaloribacter sp.]
MKDLLIIDPGRGEETAETTFLGHELRLHRVGSGGEAERIRELISAYDGKVDAIALDGIPVWLCLGRARVRHAAGGELPALARMTPVVDGSGIRAGLERWGVLLADRREPGIFSQKHVLMTPGLNHSGLADALRRRSPHVRYADPVLFFGLPPVPGVGSPRTLPKAAAPTLEHLKDLPFDRLGFRTGGAAHARAASLFRWADVLAGDVAAVRRYAPERLAHKTVVVESATETDLDDLRRRGVDIVVTMMPPLGAADGLGQWSAAVVEAALAALRPDPALPLSEDTYLDLMAELTWTPHVRYLQPGAAGINRFAFVIHPLSVDFIHRDPRFRWTRFLPDALVEAVAAYLPPLYLSKITGARSPATGQRIEGYLFALGATPRQMLRHGERFTYNRLNKAAKMAERRGARLMGLGAFTSVVGDAGITVAHENDIAITSGNSLTVAATLEAAKQAVRKMGKTDLTKGKAMVIGATGSIGAVCARLLAQAVGDVVLVSIEPERLIDLKRKILAETPGARVAIATKADDLVGDCDLIVTATSAFGRRVLDVTQCKPGAVICDVARPPDVNPAEAALRPDVLVIESGEVLIPGDVDFGYDIGLPPKTAYACLSETALLAMEGRFEDYTLGRNIELEKVKEMYRLFKKHGFRIAGLRSFGKYVTDEDVAEKRALAERLRNDPALFERTKAEAAARLAHIPVMAKGVRARRRHGTRAWLLAAAVIGAGVLLARKRRG